MAQTNYKVLDAIGYDLYSVDTTQKYRFGTIVRGVSADYGEGQFIYLKGVASTAEGVAVTYDEVGVTTLLAANAVGPVAFALGATVANTYGWYQILGKTCAKSAANCADNALVGREGADGDVGDGEAVGDQIVGAISRSATDTPATGFIWLQLFSYPFVNDFTPTAA